MNDDDSATRTRNDNNNATDDNDNATDDNDNENEGDGVETGGVVRPHPSLQVRHLPSSRSDTDEDCGDEQRQRPSMPFALSCQRPGCVQRRSSRQ
jgi:hypothetical protein